MRALVVDAYDSFVYIICQYLMKAGVELEVVRNDQLSSGLVELMAPDFVVLGPGPGHPADARYIELIRQYGACLPILGVCLGHQAIGLAFGGKVIGAKHLMHGKTSEIIHDGKGCFTELHNPFRATRYHSLIVSREGRRIVWKSLQNLRMMDILWGYGIGNFQSNLFNFILKVYALKADIKYFIISFRPMYHTHMNLKLSREDL